MSAPARLAALAVLAPLTASAACPPGGAPGFDVVAGERASVAYRAAGGIAVGEPVELEVRACTGEGRPFAGSLEVDAVMPAHGHGMNYRTSVERLAPGRYRVHGMLLHMPGRWEIRFVLRDGAGVERLSAERALR